MIDLPEATKQLRAAIELSRLPGVGAAKFKALVDQYGSPTEALYHTPRQIALLARDKTELTAEQLDGLNHLPASVKFTYYGATDYPELLGKLSEPPPYLFRKGILWPLSPMAVAIVGPRGCSDEGALFARTIAARLAVLGVLIISGGALGIDSSAHRGAMEEGKGLSVLVTATGIDRIYPSKNKELFDQVTEHGCILTELLPGTPPRRDFFPTRNRIIVALSNALIVIEGKLRTGTWSSASHALKQHRHIFVWGENPHPELRELPELLLKRGAISLSTTDPEAVMRIIKPSEHYIEPVPPA